MNIGIIGTGNIGGLLAHKLSQAGHRVSVANSRGVAGVRQFAESIGVTAADVKGAINGSEMVILAVPLPALAEMPAELFATLPADVPVVDTSNYYPDLRDVHIPALDAGQIESLWVAQQIGRPVIKAFNNILADSLAERGLPQGEQGRLAIAVAGDDAAAKQRVMEVVNQSGFDPVDGGSLADSWRQQPSTPAYCCDWDAPTMQRALAAAKPGEAVNKRDKLPEYFAALGDTPSHQEIVALNRKVNWPTE